VKALLQTSWVVVWDAVNGSGVVRIHLFPLLSLRDDHATGILSDVDDVVEVAVGVVVRVALAFLATLCNMLASQSSLLIANSKTLIEIFLHLLVL
jgi:hypothetical protein